MNSRELIDIRLACLEFVFQNLENMIRIGIAEDIVSLLIVSDEIYKYSIKDIIELRMK